MVEEQDGRAGSNRFGGALGEVQFLLVGLPSFQGLRPRSGEVPVVGHVQQVQGQR